MQIHVARNSAQLGIFAPEEIIAGLQSGRFLASDLAWREGMPNWTPLGDWPEFRAAGLTPLGPLAIGGGVRPEAGSALPSWERGASFAHYVATVKEVAFSPVQTFGQMSEGGYQRAITFLYWSSLPAWLLGSLLYGAVFFAMAAGFGGLGQELSGTPFAAWLAGVGGLTAAVLVSAGLGLLFLLLPLFQFVGAAITHVLLLPWSPAGGYARTYRASAYVVGVFMPFAFIPCLNIYVAAPWQLVVNIIALSQVHRIAWWKVVLSLVVIPCACVCGIYAMLFAALARQLAG